MRVLCAPPLRADVLAWQEQPDLWTLTVVCKATYDLAPGTSPLSRHPEEIRERDRFFGDDPKASAEAPGDLAPFKLRPEVMLVGSAFAPGGEAVQALVVRLVVGELDKSIEVLGPRSWMPDRTLRDGAPWTRMPLRYERAAGGAASWNPVGIPPNATDANGRSVMPHLQRPGHVPVEPGEILEPVGFGPIASSWGVRRDKLRDALARRGGESLRGALVGPEVDPTFFQSAPDDQRVAELRADQEITLENLHAEQALLHTRLPGVSPYARLETVDAPAKDVELVADTLWIDTDRSVCTLVWRGQVPIEGPDQTCLVRIGVGAAPAPSIRWPSSSPPESAEEMALDPGHVFDRLVELLWFDPETVPAVRHKAAWRRLLTASSHPEPSARQDQSDLERVLCRATPTSDLDEDARAEAASRRLSMVSGELELPLDDAKMLEILSSAAGSLAPDDKAVQEIVQLMKTSFAAAPYLAATLRARLGEAWTRSPRPLPLDVLEANARRVLLDQRAFRRSVVSGDEWIRASLTIVGQDAPVPAYLPVASARSLPLFVRFPARAIVEVGARQEEEDASGVSLRIVALARIVAARDR